MLHLLTYPNPIYNLKHETINVAIRNMAHKNQMKETIKFDIVLHPKLYP